MTRRQFLASAVLAKPSAVTVFREEPKRQGVAVPIHAGLKSIHLIQGEYRRCYHIDWRKDRAVAYFEAMPA